MKLFAGVGSFLFFNQKESSFTWTNIVGFFFIISSVYLLYTDKKDRITEIVTVTRCSRVEAKKRVIHIIFSYNHYINFFIFISTDVN
jgi:hypothetical protein